MNGLRVYLAGPMELAGGNWNMPLFDYVATKLRERGCEVFNPVERIRDMYGDLKTLLALDPAARKLERRDALKIELMWIVDEAQLVFLLPGWERSPGATAERAIARATGVEVREAGNIILPLPGHADMPLDLPLE